MDLPNLNPFKKKKNKDSQPQQGQPIAKIDLYSNDQTLEIAVKGEKGERVQTKFHEPPSKGLEKDYTEDITASKLRTLLLYPTDQQMEMWGVIIRPHQFIIAASLTFDEIRTEGDNRRGDKYESVASKMIKHFLKLSLAVKGNESALGKIGLKIHEDMTESSQPSSQGRINR